MEESIEIGHDTLRGCCPLSFDIGGSMTKIVYKKSENEKLSLRMISYPGGDFTKLQNQLQIILSEITSEEKETVNICATGIGSNLHKQKLQEQLNLRCKVLCEWDCFAKSLTFIGRNFSPEETFYPVSEDVLLNVRKQCQEVMDLRKARLPYSDTKYHAINCPDEVVKGVTEERKGTQCGTVKLPCILAMCGSSFVLLQIDEEENFYYVDHSDFGGMYFNILGKLVTNSQDYGHLWEMASSCDGRTADLGTPDLRDHTASPDWFSVLTEDSVGFPLGAVLQKPRDEIKDGDILHSLLSLLCRNMAQLVQLNAANLDIHNIYMCGNFIVSPHIRTVLAQQLYQTRFGRPKNEWVNLHFVKNGGFFGALGSMILSKDTN